MSGENRILSQADLEHMAKHKYSTTGYSWLDNQMNDFWLYCASKLPYWLSPNMVTVIGFFFQFLGILTIALFDLTLTQTLPTWAYFWFCWLLFLGQTFDAIDGKHARNTNRSSPLGQLMDHGCDALSNSFFVIMVVQSHTFGGSVFSVLIQFLVQAQFFVFTVEEHYTGSLRTQIENLGVTEFQFGGMGLILMPVVLGHNFSKIRFLMGYMSIGEFLTYLSLIFSMRMSLKIILMNVNSISDFVMKFYPLNSFLVLALAEFLAVKLSIFAEYPLVILFINGMYFAILTCKVIIHTMAKRDLLAYDSDAIIYLCGIVIALVSGSLMIETIAIAILGLWIFIRYFRYMGKVVLEMLEYLHISF